MPSTLINQGSEKQRKVRKRGHAHRHCAKTLKNVYKHSKPLILTHFYRAKPCCTLLRTFGDNLW